MSELTEGPESAPLGSTNLHDLEELVESRAAADPARAAEWRTYVLALREYADFEGNLPSSFDDLVNEVFADAIEDDAKPAG